MNDVGTLNDRLADDHGSLERRHSSEGTLRLQGWRRVSDLFVDKGSREDAYEPSCSAELLALISRDAYGGLLLMDEQTRLRNGKNFSRRLQDSVLPDNVMQLGGTLMTGFSQGCSRHLSGLPRGRLAKTRTCHTRLQSCREMCDLRRKLSARFFENITRSH